MSMGALARDLAVARSYVTKLRHRGLVVIVPDGAVDVRRTVVRLHKFWSPRLEWFGLKVGPVGTLLRDLWGCDAGEI